MPEVVASEKFKREECLCSEQALSDEEQPFVANLVVGHVYVYKGFVRCNSLRKSFRTEIRDLIVAYMKGL